MLLLGKHGLPAICSVDLPLWPTLTQWLIDWNRQRSTCGQCWSRSIRIGYGLLQSQNWDQFWLCTCTVYVTHTHTHLTALFPGLPGWAGTRKVKPIWTLLKQETVSSSGVSWTICKSAPRSRQVTTPASHHSVFYRPDALPAAQPTASKHWRQVQFMLN